ncbi:hypothetical protein NBRC3257_2771 [Gluconobacter thailandicus NBRC 3257]|uniref:Right handed beta helix domain-containing protein n=2 Tax=Gluconobacter thailandicus TaxID=257438 RepID=A0ABQ0J002_GLUTH|nr:hypothetical protein [Gluconobacter thailandicus]GAC88612.1 hypothetical protein NBRC3255_2273 [Gluconobacter thailandicus NBRC 3255]GAD27772.1 hypothetical protein NBRC3257_2771 [Gluconobacter thailandicus NBRC 3257]
MKRYFACLILLPSLAYAEPQSSYSAITSRQATVDVRDFGARCDVQLAPTSTQNSIIMSSGTDDSAAFQKAVTFASRTGKQLTYTGNCYVSQTIAIPEDAQSFNLDGRNNIIFYKGDGNLFSFSGSSGAVSSSFSIRNVKAIIPQDNYSHPTSAFSFVGGKWQGVLDHVTTKGFHQGIRIINSSAIRIQNSTFNGWGNSTGIYISGTYDQSGAGKNIYSANISIRDTTVLYGSGIYIDDSVQGIGLDHFSILEGQGWGVYFKFSKNNGSQSLEIQNSYLEASSGGVLADNIGEVHITNTNVDGVSFRSDKNWTGFHLLNMFGGTLENNTAIGYQDSTWGPFYVGGNVLMIGNNVVGGLNISPCMTLVPHNKNSSAPGMIVSHNMCWATGGYQVVTEDGTDSTQARNIKAATSSSVIGQGISGTDNLWSGPKKDNWLSVTFAPNGVREIGTNLQVDKNLSIRGDAMIDGALSASKGLHVAGASGIAFGDNSSNIPPVQLSSDRNGNLAIKNGGFRPAQLRAEALPARCEAGTVFYVPDARNPGEVHARGMGALAVCNSAGHWLTNGQPVSN